ncbi:MAG: Trk family potassium uptake protein [Elusimicrobia bacterium]|nr:Trk family potassium uptake protein [Elusimicrobiota bacterium]
MKLSPQQILIIGFAAIIISGSVLLSLPVSSVSGVSTNFTDAFFTATSAVCVTGLIVVNTATHWSIFGKVIIALLIQIGALGYMTLATLFLIMIGKQISLKDRLVFAEGIQTLSFVELKKFIVYIAKVTLIVELLGAVLLSLKWIPEYGFLTGVGYSVFHSISAFCNAGFSLFESNFVKYIGSVPVNLIITTLVIIGGIGYIVMSDIYTYTKTKRFLLHTKIVTTTTFILIISAAILIFCFGYNNPQTLGPLPLKYKILASYFHAVVPRTAGFNTLNISNFSTPMLLLFMGLMFIGASPSGTGGGIKTTTFATIIAAITSTLTGKKDVSIFKRTVQPEIVRKSFVLVSLSLIFIFVMTFFILFIEGKTFIKTLFEVFSAFATCGLSTAEGTPLSFCSLFTPLGKILIVITMFIGRLGPLTIAVAVMEENGATKFKYAEGKVAVG